MKSFFYLLLPLLFAAAIVHFVQQQPEADMDSPKDDFAVIAYYTGTPMPLETAVVDKLTHIIYSFLHLQGNKLALDDERDGEVLSYLVSLKKKHPGLKVMLSLGGWGGCETCSEVFSTAEGREAFSASVRELLLRFDADGIDLDWEYPTIEGFPGHPYAAQDKENFTAMVKTLRQTLGSRYEISFAAGGFPEFLEKSVDWKAVMPYMDRVNLMSYDLVNGNSVATGHHTPLYSTSSQIESADHAIQFLDSLGIPRHKMVIGAAFYARVWEKVSKQNRGLYQTGQFQRAIPYQQLDSYFAGNPGFESYWDSVAQAPYRYHPAQQLFATYDDKLSIREKTAYALQEQLGGIMFWQLSGDIPHEGLLHVIDSVKTNHNQGKK